MKVDAESARRATKKLDLRGGHRHQAQEPRKPARCTKPSTRKTTKHLKKQESYMVIRAAIDATSIAHARTLMGAVVLPPFLVGICGVHFGVLFRLRSGEIAHFACASAFDHHCSRFSCRGPFPCPRRPHAWPACSSMPPHARSRTAQRRPSQDIASWRAWVITRRQGIISLRHLVAPNDLLAPHRQRASCMLEQSLMLWVEHAGYLK